jgi:hypothetical protein
MKFLMKLQVQFWNRHVIVDTQECYKEKRVWDFRFSRRWLRVWPSWLWRRLVRRQPEVSVERMVSIFRLETEAICSSEVPGRRRTTRPSNRTFQTGISRYISGRSSDQSTQPGHLPIWTPVITAEVRKRYIGTVQRISLLVITSVLRVLWF